MPQNKMLYGLYCIENLASQDKKEISRERMCEMILEHVKEMRENLLEIIDNDEE